MSLEQSIKNIQESLETVKELTETVSDFGEVIDETVVKVDSVSEKVDSIEGKQEAHENKLDTKFERTSKRQDIVEKKVEVIGEIVDDFQSFLDITNERVTSLESVEVYNDQPIQENLQEQKYGLKQAVIDIKKLDKQKADNEHKHVIKDIEGLPEILEDIKNKPSGPVSVGGYTKGIRGIQVGPNMTIDNTDPRFPVLDSIGGGGGASSTEITQTGHGFVDLDWLYFDETDDTYKKAQSDSVDTLGAWHVVEVVDANTFKIAKDGVHEIANTLDLGEYVLSQDTAGGYTQTLPGDLGDYVLYGMEVLSSTHISFYTVPAIPVGDTGDGVQSVVAGTGITVDNTDPLNPIINATGGSGTVTSVAISGSDGLEVDSGSPITTTGTIALGVNKTAMLSHLNVEDGADVTDATNVGVAGAFMKATDDTDDITEGVTNLFMDSTEQGKLANITVTQAVDLDQMESDIAALANGMVYKGNWDASAGTFPGGGTAQTGRFYTVSVGGTVDSVVFNVDDRLVATVDNASTTTYAGNWTKLDATDAVTSVFGRPGNVVATNGDYTASQITNVAAGGISAVTVQTAIDELDTEKAPKTSPTFATSINGSYLTASEILITDASKNIVSAPVATYPSLTELSYGKGVTSAIQTQLDTKQPDIQFKDEGTNAGTAGGVTIIDFVGTGVTASESAGTLTVTIPGGGGSPGGTDTQLQFNDGGTFGGIPEITWDKTTKVFTVNSILDGAGVIYYVANTAESSYTYLEFTDSEFGLDTPQASFFTGASGLSLTQGGTSALFDVSGLASSDKTFTFQNKTGILALTYLPVEANTAGVGSPNLITDIESSTVFTNEGTTAKNYHTLPTAVAGLTYTFYVDDADGIRVVANTGDIIQINGVASTTAGYCDSTAIGSSVTLTAINATDWVATSVVGTWTLG